MSKTSFDAQTISNSLRAAKHQPRKRFGQNFLHDTSVIREIVESIRLERDDNLIEIGPGTLRLSKTMRCMWTTVSYIVKSAVSCA